MTGSKDLRSEADTVWVYGDKFDTHSNLVMLLPDSSVNPALPPVMKVVTFRLGSCVDCRSRACQLMSLLLVRAPIPSGQATALAFTVAENKYRVMEAVAAFLDSTTSFLCCFLSCLFAFPGRLRLVLSMCDTFFGRPLNKLCKPSAVSDALAMVTCQFFMYSHVCDACNVSESIGRVCSLELPYKQQRVY